jgi:two-component sensor histidine kinase
MGLFLSAAQSPGAQPPVTFRAVHKDGHIVHGYSCLTASWEGDQIAGYAAIVQDVSESMQAELEMQRLYKQAQRDAEAKTTLLQEVHHRVKNNLQIISSLLDLQADTIRDPRVLHALQDSQHRVRAMAMVHESLYRAPELDQVHLEEYVLELLDYLLGAYAGPATTIDRRLQLQDIALGLDQAIPFGLILTELLTNVLKHAFSDGRAGVIQIVLRPHGDQIELIVSDNGTGLPADLDPQTTTSLGLTIVQLLVRQLKGELKAESAAETGTTFTIVFPLPEESRL